jgi:hypothetical protein
MKKTEIGNRSLNGNSLSIPTRGLITGACVRFEPNYAAGTSAVGFIFCAALPPLGMIATEVMPRVNQAIARRQG